MVSGSCTAALHAAPLIRRLFPSLACARAPGATPSPTRGEGGTRHLRFGRSLALAVGSYAIGDWQLRRMPCFSVGEWRCRQCQAPPSPLVGEGGPARLPKPKGEADASGRMRGAGRSSALQAGIVRVADNGVGLLHRRAPRNTPHPSPFPVPCSRKGRGRHLLPQGEKGEHCVLRSRQSSASVIGSYAIGDWQLRRMPCFSVGEWRCRRYRDG